MFAGIPPAAGLKAGCLLGEALAGATVLDADCRIADVLARVNAVYTVSSLTGFEALIRGLPVRCFGVPFYAGWGATPDEASARTSADAERRRRTVRRRLSGLCAMSIL